MNSIFSLRNVTVAYDTPQGVFTALSDMTLDVAAGEFVAIVGRNGSGKSTLARVLMQLCGISRGGLEMYAHTAPHRLPVQMVFQHPDAQIVGETVFEDIAFGLQNVACPVDGMQREIQEATQAVHLDATWTQAVTSLSGGQKQRLCIADCLVLHPDVLVFDESTSMLDGAMRQRILEIAENLHRAGRTIVWITQHMDEVAAATRVVALDAGKQVFDGSPVDFFYGQPPLSGHPWPEAPCRALGFPLPFIPATVQALWHRGAATGARPLRREEFAKVVRDTCRFASST